MAEENNAQKNDTVGLFLRAMVDREPGKRKVKPSKAALIDLAELDLGESSDDSDFNVDEAKLKEDDDISINSDPDEDINDDDDDEDDEEDEDVEEEKAVNFKSQIHEKSNMSIGELLAQAREKQALAAEQGMIRPKILVCAICLGEHSDDANEIVTCDGCHVSVHEGCYGISDTISVSSTVSSSSTEPWFCDACKAGVANPPCELCPNLGYTIFKETEMGRWVHLVCALYVPGVAFSEVDKLSFPTLFEMPYSKYGAKTCSLCEDERYCKTGVCIGCDAGMCRSYFHVTCAQREGLLSEVNHGEADQADPYYAHCKLHTDRELMRRRKRNWLALQLHMRQGEKEKQSESQETQDRLERKLVKYREKYLLTKSNRPTPWFPTQKMPRSISTCASFFRSLLHKTQLMGVEPESSVVEPQSLGDVRKKWHIPPAFNVEFISYYLDRTSRLQEMKSRLSFLLQENDELMKEESRLRSRYNTLSVEAEAVETENAALLNKALELHDMLKGLAGRPLRLPPVVAALHNPPFVDVEPTNVGGSGGAIGGGKEKRLITKAAAKMMGGNLPAMPAGLDNDGVFRSSSEKIFGADSASVMSIHPCSVCQSTKEQHMLIQCDTCSHYYHLSCLDPPLSRMPKKTKQMGWQCSDCCKSSDSDKAPEIDTAAPRRLRRIIKEPTKFSPSVAKDQKIPQDRPPDSEVTTDTSSSAATGAVKGKAPAKNNSSKSGTKRRLSADGKRGKQKVRRRSLDTPRKGNKTPKEGPPQDGKVSLSTDEVQSPKKNSPVPKAGSSPTVKGEAQQPPKDEPPPLKVESKVEAKVEDKVEKPPLPPPPPPPPPTPTPKVETPSLVADEVKVESKEETRSKSPLPPATTAGTTNSTQEAAPIIAPMGTPPRSTRARKGAAADAPTKPSPSPLAKVAQLPVEKKLPSPQNEQPLKETPSTRDTEPEEGVTAPSEKEGPPSTETKTPIAPSDTVMPPSGTAVTLPSGISCSSPPTVPVGMPLASASSSLPSSSSSSSSSSAAGPTLGGASLDVSADSLPSPHSESFPSEEDPLCSSRRERRHREGGKKKKKDRDKEEGGRKRKKHHRERHSLGEMASEMVSPFRIKIKPLPPRPNGLENMSAPGPVPTRTQANEVVASHTTPTTTAPPGYPPLPPGYTLTQPMLMASNHTPNPPQDTTNGTGPRTQTSTLTISTNSTTTTTSTTTVATTTTNSSTTAPIPVGARASIGRRKSDPGAEQFSKCDVCGETGGVTNTVMCDECLKAYHFNCLEPPLKKSPKRRGYSWFCEDCDNASEKK